MKILKVDVLIDIYIKKINIDQIFFINNTDDIYLCIIDDYIDKEFTSKPPRYSRHYCIDVWKSETHIDKFIVLMYSHKSHLNFRWEAIKPSGEHNKYRDTQQN